MRLVSCLVTYNRLNYTQRTLESLIDAGNWPIVVVDNASTDGTRDYLRRMEAHKGVHVVYNERNLYPGAACNIGWHHALKLAPDAQLLHRSDNDVEYEQDWADEVAGCFTEIPRLGQLGVLDMHEDYPEGTPTKLYAGRINIHFNTVGGNCVIRRELWDNGLRWEAGPWGPGKCEDALMSEAVHAAGYGYGIVTKPIASNISFHRFEDYPDYYAETAQRRGLVPELSV